MTLREQKELATKHNLSTSTDSVVMDQIKSELKYHFNIKSSEDKENLRKMQMKWATEKYKELLSDGMDEKEAKDEALDFALEMTSQLKTSSKSSVWCIWSLGDSVERVIDNAVGEINDEYDMSMKLYVFDAYIGTTQDFDSVIQIIRDTKESAALLIKNCTWTTPDVFRCIYNAVRYPDAKNPYVILTSPLELPEGERKIWDASLPVCHTVLLEKE